MRGCVGIEDVGYVRGVGGVHFGNDLGGER